MIWTLFLSVKPEYSIPVRVFVEIWLKFQRILTKNNFETEPIRFFLIYYRMRRKLCTKRRMTDAVYTESYEMYGELQGKSSVQWRKIE